jgi:hypothetical protein
MMAFERTPSSESLDASTIQALRTTLARSAKLGNHDDELRELLCRTAEEARAKGIQAERLLVILKDVWYSLPEVAGARSSQAQHALLQDLISRGIQEYYSL